MPAVCSACRRPGAVRYCTDGDRDLPLSRRTERLSRAPAARPGVRARMRPRRDGQACDRGARRPAHRNRPAVRERRAGRTRPAARRRRPCRSPARTRRAGGPRCNGAATGGMALRRRRASRRPRATAAPRRVRHLLRQPLPRRRTRGARRAGEPDRADARPRTAQAACGRARLLPACAAAGRPVARAVRAARSRAAHATVPAVPALQRAAAPRVPAGVRLRHRRFAACDVCRRVFWEGSH
ncbi:hypothetical protein F01_30019 [Burkholderia cenocepacia]|nr:hypothetical protein F01_30019 [Burkholderia cenocepacia]SPU95732.1 thiS family protein [Burkholderia cenocepacia]